MNDINDEFDELDSLLKEVDELKVQQLEQEIPESLQEESKRPDAHEELADIKRRAKMRKQNLPCD